MKNTLDRVLLKIIGVGSFIPTIVLIFYVFVWSKVDPNLSAILSVMAASFVVWILVRSREQVKSETP